VEAERRFSIKYCTITQQRLNWKENEERCLKSKASLASVRYLKIIAHKLNSRSTWTRAAPLCAKGYSSVQRTHSWNLLLLFSQKAKKTTENWEKFLTWIQVTMDTNSTLFLLYNVSFSLPKPLDGDRYHEPYIFLFFEWFHPTTSSLTRNYKAFYEKFKKTKEEVCFLRPAAMFFFRRQNLYLARVGSSIVIGLFFLPCSGSDYVAGFQWTLCEISTYNLAS